MTKGYNRRNWRVGAPGWLTETVSRKVKENAPQWLKDVFGTTDEAEEARVQDMSVPMENKVTGDGDILTELGNVISKAESPRFGYDSWYGRGTSQGPVDPPKNPTQMTIAEVLQWQRTNNPPGPGTTAIGRYQFVDQPNAPTLSSLVRKLGIDPNTTLFDKETQDMLFREKLKERGLDDYLSGKLTIERFMNNLAKEWAGLPVATNTRRGKTKLQPGWSYYSGLGGNKAHVSVDEVKTVLTLAQIDNEEEGNT